MTDVTPKRGRVATRPAPSKGLSGAERLNHWKGDPDFMLSLARGLLVLRAIADAGRPIAIAEVASLTGLSRATARRCVYTLSELDYVSVGAAGCVAGSRLASLTSAYISSSPLIAGCRPILDRLRDHLREGVSLGIFDSGEAVYVARAEVERRWALPLELGARLPAYCSSLGRVLLAFKPQAQIDEYLAHTELLPRTERTVTSPERLLEILAEVRRQGYCIGDQELEIGLRSISVPVRDRAGVVVAAVNVGTQPAKVGLRELKSRVLPPLLEAAAELSTLSP